MVLGTTSDQARTQESLKLMNYGYQMFETVKLYSAKQAISTSEVYKGQAKEVKLGVNKDLLINVPRGMAKQLKATVEKKGTLIAPIPAGTELGSLKLTLNGETIGTVPLLALSTVEEAGLFGRMVDSAKLWFEE